MLDFNQPTAVTCATAPLIKVVLGVAFVDQQPLPNKFVSPMWIKCLENTENAFGGCLQKEKEKEKPKPKDRIKSACILMFDWLFCADQSKLI